jgi:uncharacterized protein (DUF2384 family)
VIGMTLVNVRFLLERDGILTLSLPPEQLAAAELSALVERLARVMEPSYIAVWLRKPVPALAERKPIDVIAGGEYLRVAELVSTLEEASFS